MAPRGSNARPRRINAGYRRTPFGWFIHAIVANPVMPVVTIGTVVAFVTATFIYFGQNNNGVEFFVESEPEQAIVYVRARGNLSLAEKDILVKQVEDVVIADPGVDSAFAFAGAGGLNANTGGAAGPRDTIGQIQIETDPVGGRAPTAAIDVRVFPRGSGRRRVIDLHGTSGRDPRHPDRDPEPGARPRLGQTGASAPEGRRLGDAAGRSRADRARASSRTTEGLIEIEDTLPLPGIDWQIDVDVEKAGRYGADVTTVGAMVQLITRGILLDTMRVDSSDEEIDIRVRLPQEDRVLSTLDTLKVRTADGLVPLSNFITREPVAQLAQINRIVDFDVKATLFRRQGRRRSPDPRLTPHAPAPPT